MRNPQRCLGIFFAFLFVALPAKGDCLNWERYVGAPSHSLQYAGTVGGRPIRMMLHLDVAASRFTGIYGYSNQPDPLQLIGTLGPDGHAVHLVEHDPRGHETGRFDLRIFRPRRYGEVRNPLPGCDDLVGEWQSAKGGRQLEVVLRLAGDWDPKNDQARQLNESTAYKLRQAMVDGDRKALSMLLRYPFHSERGHGAVSVWNKPQDVIDHYRQIVLFPEQVIEEAVPHALSGGGGRSVFMNGSVLIDYGKVSWICESACPVAP